MNVCPTCHETFGAHLTVCPRDGTLLEGAATQGDRLVGRLLSGRYQVHERVGSGGFGTVYRVTDTHFDDVEALKGFDRKRFDARESEEAMERFAREAKLLRRLGKQTPHIVSVTNFVKDDEAGLFYFTMEYVEGNNLAQILVREGPLELWRAVGFLRQLCEALTIAQSHDPPVVHRDLKLENLMVTADGEEEELRVLDFGIAKIIGHGSLTSLQLGPGTPGYAAPEQVDRPTQVDHRADLFAMGVAFYGMLTAREPWTGGS